MSKQEFWENCPNNLTDEECELIDLRRMGYTLEEISNIAGRGRSYVKQKKNLFGNSKDKRMQ